MLCGTVDNVLLLDVIPLSLGIETLGGVFSKIINRNTTIPFKHTETFSTSEDGQKEVDINIFQGERALVSDNKYLGKIKLINIPPRPEVFRKLMLKVTAVDNLTKKNQELTVTPSSGLSDAEVEKIVKDAESKSENDALKIERVDFKNNFKNNFNEFIYNLNRRSEKTPDNIKSLFLEIEDGIKNDDFDF